MTDDIKALLERLRHYGDNDRNLAASLIEGEAAEVAALLGEIENLNSVMIAAAEEIHEHWAAHCDAEGYGPANLMHRLEKGIPAQYAYKAGDFERLRAELAEAREKLAAAEVDAERYRWLRDDTDSDWAICEWSTREVDGIGYYRDSRRPDIVDAAIDAARAKT